MLDPTLMLLLMGLLALYATTVLQGNDDLE
jgi:hypothetical protein